MKSYRAYCRCHRKRRWTQELGEIMLMWTCAMILLLSVVIFPALAYFN
jgi:hypothetical protein